MTFDPSVASGRDLSIDDKSVWAESRRPPRPGGAEGGIAVPVGLQSVNLLIVIPARGGSKGLPRKNLLTAGGVSLVGRAVIAARNFVSDVRSLTAGIVVEAAIVVDTDSPEIAEEGKRWGAAVPFLRPAELAGDTTPTIENVLFLMDRMARRFPSADAVLLLQPTSPLRRPEDILRCWGAFNPATSPSVVSVASSSHPVELLLRREEDGTLHWVGAAAPLALHRQAFPAQYSLNGAVCIATPQFLRRHRAFVVPGCTRGVPMPSERSLDIDTAGDLELADAILAQAKTPFVRIGDRQIGGGARCCIIAEAGVNHNGDASLAHRLVDAAADAGADAVKFQTFDPDRVVSRDARLAAYQVVDPQRDESQLALLRRLVLPPDAFAQLRAHANERHLVFLSTPFDEASADFLDSIGVVAFKIPSGEITNPPFLAHVARKGKPMLISTGMSSLPEVVDALETVRAHGHPPVALFHCVTNYPAAPRECNLRAMATMRSLLHVPVGWSDHSEGMSLSVAAVAMGAQLLEKHFTLDRSLPGPDHRASLEPAELGALVAAIRATEASFGDGLKEPVPAELANALEVRRSLHAARDLKAGEVLGMSDLVLLRPGRGIPASRAGPLMGRRLKVPVPAGSLLREVDLE